MPTNYSIQLEREIAGLEYAIQGEALAREAADLDWIAKECGVPALSDFLGAEFVSPELGLDTVQMLLREIGAYPHLGKDYSRVLEELRGCESVLTAAAAHSVHWRFHCEKALS